MASIIKNLTPHSIHLVDENNNIIRTFLPDGLVRLKTIIVDAGQIDGCRITTTQFGEPEGLPDCIFSAFCENCGEEYTEKIAGEFCPVCGWQIHTTEIPVIFYLVSQPVKSALPSRKDLLVPAEVVRDEKGNIIGCRSFGI
jgi:hypothetical protein